MGGLPPHVAAKVDEAKAIIAKAVKRHSPKGVVALFSGGHDSIIATDIASTHPAFRGCASMETTIAIPEALDFRRDVAAAYQWRPREYVAPVSYRDIVLKHGFPGPAAHLFMYRRLKERGLRNLMHDIQHRAGDRVVLVTGVRKAESVRRMGHVEAIRREDAKVWTAPILNWTDEDKDIYLSWRGLPRNPVTKKLCLSGECICGAFAAPEERVEIRHHYPEVDRDLSELEWHAKRAGVHAVWGTRPAGDNRRATAAGPMCAGCAHRLPADEIQSIEAAA